MRWLEMNTATCLDSKQATGLCTWLCFRTAHKAGDPVCTLGLPEPSAQEPSADQPVTPASPQLPSPKSLLLPASLAPQPAPGLPARGLMAAPSQLQALATVARGHFPHKHQALRVQKSKREWSDHVGSRVGPRVEGFLSLGLALIPWWPGTVHGLVFLDLTISNGD